MSRDLREVRDPAMQISVTSSEAERAGRAMTLRWEDVWGLAGGQ